MAPPPSLVLKQRDKDYDARLHTLTTIPRSLIVTPPLSLLLGFTFLALLAWHIWRDRRGARHNAADCCYTCGCPLTGSAQPISHYKGETYRYCGPCATWHQRRRVGGLGGRARGGGDPGAGPMSPA